MKGIFNKTLVIALLVSVCGVRAEVTDMSGKQLFVAAATQLSKEAKDAAVAGLNVVKNSATFATTANGVRAVGSSVVKGVNVVSSVVANSASAVSAKMAPVVAKQAEMLKRGANFISSDVISAGTLVKRGVVKAADLSKPALAAALGYAVSAKDSAKLFYANHTDACKAAAITAVYVAYIYACIKISQKSRKAVQKPVTKAVRTVKGKKSQVIRVKVKTAPVAMTKVVA